MTAQAPARPAPASPVPAVVPPKNAAGNSSGKGWVAPRKVDATPLDQNINAKPTAGPQGARKVQISEKKHFPWLAVGLLGLIALAAGVVLVYTGVVKFPQ